MEFNIGSRIKKAWNAFTNRDPTSYNRGNVYSRRPDRAYFSRGNDRSIINTVYTRIALDVSQIEIKHCKLDGDERYLETIDSGLNKCLNFSANTDETGTAFRLDLVISMLDEGCIAIVPTETYGEDPRYSENYRIDQLRVAKILEWMPKHVRLRVYDENDGNKKDIVLPKKMVAIIENPFYSIMNQPNSTLQRLIRKLSLLDVTDEATASGKLDLIISLPYAVKTPARKRQAEERREDIERQLSGSKYGIAYTDGTERITQLNRSLENNLMNQIKYLTDLLFSQLGINQGILDGTANEETMLNYYNRVIEPISTAITDEFKRKFLSKTAISQGQSIMAFRNPFKLVPVNSVAEIADKLTRNEILTSNEVRQIVGYKPSDDPKADQLINSNISQSNETIKNINNTESGDQNGE